MKALPHRRERAPTPWRSSELRSPASSREPDSLPRLTHLLTHLRNQWPQLTAPNPFVEMANVLKSVHHEWSTCERPRVPRDPDGQLEALLLAITQYYLEDDGRSLQHARQRLLGLERVLVEHLSGVDEPEALMEDSLSHQDRQEFSRILTEAVARAIAELRKD